MSMQPSRDAHARDPRTALVREKYFSLRPKPLERWLWQHGLPQAAERVFWVHWEEGMRAGDWCSQIPLKRVAMLCCIDPSTVTRAYQVLKGLGLIRREDPGRDPENPFQQATAVTEVRIPRELLVELSRAPNRPGRSGRPEPVASNEVGRAPASPTPNPSGRVSDERGNAARPPSDPPPTPAAAPNAPTPPPHLKYRDYQRIMGRFSTREKAAYSRAWADRAGAMTFDPATTLSAEEQRHVLWQLHLVARPAAPEPAPKAATLPHATPAPYTGPRRLAPLEAARLRKKVLETVPASEAPETFRQVLWAVEEGALRRFEAAKAVNIALKKIREGAWTRPNRMPPQWRITGSPAISAGGGGGRILADALRETCSAA